MFKNNKNKYSKILILVIALSTVVIFQTSKSIISLTSWLSANDSNITTEEKSNPNQQPAQIESTSQTQIVTTQTSKSNPIITTKTINLTQSIAFTTIKQNDPNLKKGKTIIAQKGVNGKKEATYSITYTNNKETDRKLTKTTVVKKPVNQIVKIGIKSPEPSGNFNYAQAKAILTYVNQERIKAGVATLYWRDDLAYYAKTRATETVTLFDHIRPNGLKYNSLNPNLINGENLVAGTPIPATAQQAVNQWMNSPSHKANIIEPRFKSMGGAYLINSNSKYKNYWVQLFSVK